MSDIAIDHRALSAPDREKLREHVEKLSVLRHGGENYASLEQTAHYIERYLVSCGLQPENQYLHFRNRVYRNIVACKKGLGNLPPLVLGAHYDSNRGTPGADDNASGVAVLLETARILQSVELERSIELVAFTLEEPQTISHIIRRGSRFFARQAKRARVRYEGAVILECIGYTAPKQDGALLSKLAGLELPQAGDFLAVVSNGASEPLMEEFLRAARASVPSLNVVGYAMPAEGYLLPQARFSDHSSFWERGYRSIMLNDTVMFRNPHYHGSGDVPETLDYDFMTRVAGAVLGFVAGYR